MNKNKKKGFTLVELLVVIAILAILASVSVVGYLGFTKQAKESKAQTELTQFKTVALGELVDGNYESADKSIKITYEAGKGIKVVKAAGETEENQKSAIQTLMGFEENTKGKISNLNDNTDVNAYNTVINKIEYKVDGATAVWDLETNDVTNK